MESFPSRERGLKLLYCHKSAHNMFVVPLAGTWIEITIAFAQRFASHTSFPSRERGLKWTISLFAVKFSRSFPSRERGLKYWKRLKNVIQNGMSFPSRERGLKSGDGRKWKTAHWSFPSRERGLKYIS